MPNSEHRPKVTIEDLLHLKRAERPAAEFWQNFEHELRQKQLTALIQKRSWWQGMPQLFFRRAYLPIGATAILTFTLVSVRLYSPQQVAQVDSTPTATPESNVHRAAQPTAEVAVSSPLLNHNDVSTRRLEDRPSAVASVVPVSVVQPEALEVAAAPASNERPSARTIAANLAHLEQSEPDLISSVLGRRLSASSRVQTVSSPGRELETLSISANRRNRLLANYNERQLNPEPTAPDIVRERLSRRLGDADYADRFSRIGLKGDQVSLGLTIKL